MFKQAAILVVTLLLAGSTNAGDLSKTCGNVDASPDGRINLSDITYLIAIVYQQADPPPIPLLADVDGSADGKLNLADITRLISYVYLDHAPLACPLMFENSQSECLSGNSSLEAGSFTTEVIGNNLHLYHTSAYYQCCLDYAVDFELENYKITAYESDNGALCDCNCTFDLESVIYFLPEGEYEVVLIGIDGDTVGVDTALILAEFGLVDFDQSECLGDPIQSLSQNDISYLYDAGQLTLVHVGAVFNCGFDLDILIDRAEDTVRIYERNVRPMDGQFKCLCLYDLTATIDGLEPGEYVLEVYNHDYFMMGREATLVDRRTILLGNQ